jgi:hypothetical protein
MTDEQKIQVQRRPIHQPKNPFEAERAKWECSSYLGEVAAQIFFFYSIQRKDLGVNRLLKWTQSLQEAVYKQQKKFIPKRMNRTSNEKLCPNPKIDKPQISKWRRANPLPAGTYKLTEGLDFRLLNLEICGEGDRPWQGNLILIYEAKTDSLFHQFVKPSKTSKVTEDLIFYVIGKAVESINTKFDGTSLSTSAKTLSVASVASTNTEVADAYELVLKQIIERSKINETFDYKWLRQHKVQINFFDWQIQRSNLEPAEKICIDIKKATIDIDTAGKFRNNLVRISNKMTRIAKKQNYPFTWYSLNPAKVQIVKSADWYNKKNESV